MQSHGKSRSLVKTWLTVIGASLVLAACGGGGGGTTTTPVALALMVDSFGNQVPEASFGGGDAGAAGADGGSGDGAPIPNAPVTIVDANGRSVSGRTDANGRYRLRIDGFVPPMIAKVTRSDGVVWHSPSITAPVTRGFINMSLNGLTDKIASDVAAAGGKSSAAELTPALINPTVLKTAKTNLNTQISSVLKAGGLDPATFDPVTTPLVTDHKGYDYVLDNTVITKVGNGPTTVAISPTFVDPSTPTAPTGLSGNWSVLTEFVSCTGNVDGSTLNTCPSLPATSGGTVPGSAVPSTSSLAQTQFQAVQDCALFTSAANQAGMTVTSCSSNSFTVVYQGITEKVTYSNPTISSYSGCGTCGVGSKVSFNVSMTLTAVLSGAGVSATTITVNTVTKTTFTRIS